MSEGTLENFKRIWSYKQYIENDGIVFGGSAGAIIFGKDEEFVVV